MTQSNLNDSFESHLNANDSLYSKWYNFHRFQCSCRTKDLPPKNLSPMENFFIRSAQSTALPKVSQFSNGAFVLDQNGIYILYTTTSHHKLNFTPSHFFFTGRTFLLSERRTLHAFDLVRPTMVREFDAEIEFVSGCEEEGLALIVTGGCIELVDIGTGESVCAPLSLVKEHISAGTGAHGNSSPVIIAAAWNPHTHLILLSTGTTVKIYNNRLILQCTIRATGSIAVFSENLFGVFDGEELVLFENNGCEFARYLMIGQSSGMEDHEPLKSEKKFMNSVEDLPGAETEPQLSVEATLRSSTEIKFLDRSTLVILNKDEGRIRLLFFKNDKWYRKIDWTIRTELLGISQNQIYALHRGPDILTKYKIFREYTKNENSQFYVTDGSSVLFYDFNCGIVPPPYCTRTLHFDEPVRLIAADHSRIAVLVGRFVEVYVLSDPTTYLLQHEIEVPDEIILDLILLGNDLHFRTDKSLYSVDLIKNERSVRSVSFNILRMGNYRNQLILIGDLFCGVDLSECEFVDFQWSPAGTFLQADDVLYRLDESLIDDNVNETNNNDSIADSVTGSFTDSIADNISSTFESIAQMDINATGTVAVNKSTNNLPESKLSSITIAKGVISFFAAHNSLLYTTETLLNIVTSKKTSFVAERNSSILCLPSSAILYIPRGNLESFRIEEFIVDEVLSELEKRNYKKMIYLMMTHFVSVEGLVERMMNDVEKKAIDTKENGIRTQIEEGLGERMMNDVEKKMIDMKEVGSRKQVENGEWTDTEIGNTTKCAKIAVLKILISKFNIASLKETVDEERIIWLFSQIFLCAGSVFDRWGDCEKLDSFLVELSMIRDLLPKCLIRARFIYHALRLLVNYKAGAEIIDTETDSRNISDSIKSKKIENLPGFVKDALRYTSPEDLFKQSLLVLDVDLSQKIAVELDSPEFRRDAERLRTKFAVYEYLGMYERALDSLVLYSKNLDMSVVLPFIERHNLYEHSLAYKNSEFNHFYKEHCIKTNNFEKAFHLSMQLKDLGSAFSLSLNLGLDCARMVFEAQYRILADSLLKRLKFEEAGIVLRDFLGIDASGVFLKANRPWLALQSFLQFAKNEGNNVKIDLRGSDSYNKMIEDICHEEENNLDLKKKTVLAMESIEELKNSTGLEAFKTGLKQLNTAQRQKQVALAEKIKKYQERSALLEQNFDVSTTISKFSVCKGAPKMNEEEFCEFRIAMLKKELDECRIGEIEEVGRILGLKF